MRPRLASCNVRHIQLQLVWTKKSNLDLALQRLVIADYLCYLGAMNFVNLCRNFKR